VAERKNTTATKKTRSACSTAVNTPVLGHERMTGECGRLPRLHTLDKAQEGLRDRKKKQPKTKQGTTKAKVKWEYLQKIARALELKLGRTTNKNRMELKTPRIGTKNKTRALRPGTTCTGVAYPRCRTVNPVLSRPPIYWLWGSFIG